MGLIMIKLLLMMMIIIIMLLTLCSSSVLGSQLRRFKWSAEYIYWSPDCVETVLIGLNGAYPGPTIRATAGDTIEVEFHNGLGSEGLMIHWHGIRQIGTPFYDGTGSVSQCPILPGETFIYKFVVDRPGTYFYHGHFGLQRSAGLYGSLIVDPAPDDPAPFTYDGELSIILNDWWHRSIYNQEAGLEHIPFRFVGEPQSLLIEGRGQYNCTLIPPPAAASQSPVGLSGDVLSCNNSNPQCGMHVLSVEAGKRYRLRLASVASLSSINFALESHSMILVEADGHYTEPIKIDNLDLYSGQTYSVLFTADQNPAANYWAAINVRGRKPTTPTGLAILSYESRSSSSSNSTSNSLQAPSPSLPRTAPPVSPVWDDFAYSQLQQQSIVALKSPSPARLEDQDLPRRRANVKIMLLSTQNRVNGKLRWAINNVSYVPRSTPLLAALKYNLTGDDYDFQVEPPTSFPRGYRIRDAPVNPNATAGSGVYVFKLHDVVDVVLQNANTLTVNNSEIHPWHLHGHDFWVLGYGGGIFRPRRHTKLLNFRNPPLRNTVAVFPYGWTYIRFQANNPGAWAFHCHIESHFHMGMGVMFAEGIDRLPHIPNQVLGCGLTKAFLKAP